jgi:hypothetical protein
MSRRLFVLAALLSARVAHANTECLFQGGYSDPENWMAVCVATETVPLGCPIDFIAPHGLYTTPDSVPFTVTRGNDPVTLTGSAALDSTYEVTVSTIDVYSCDCARETGPVSYDRFTLTLGGTMEGDMIRIGNEYDENAYVTIAAAGQCPLTVWPTMVDQATACDVCPDPTGSGNGSGSGSGSTDHPARLGCSTGHSVGVLPIALALLLARRRRR